MARPTRITDEQILDAAREVFMADGYGASTAEIARRAGVSEGTLFKRFKTKEGLFLAAMQISTVPPWVRLAQALIGQGDMKENLLTIGMDFVRFLHVTVPRLMMLWSSRIGAHDPACGLEEPPPVRDRRLFADFIRREAELGRVRPCDPAAVSQVFIASLAGYVFDTFMLRLERTPEEEEEFVREFIEIIWRGLTPAPA